jgi:predicted DNA-binding transcriptional regulator AlpA
LEPRTPGTVGHDRERRHLAGHDPEDDMSTKKQTHDRNRRPPTEIIPRLITARDVAARFGVSEDRVYRAAVNRELPSYLLANRTRRFDPVEVVAWLQSKRSGPEVDGADVVIERILSGTVPVEALARLRQALDDVLREAA